MESAKVLDNGRTVVFDMKRKRAARCMAYFTGASCTYSPCSVQDALPERYCKQTDSHLHSDGPKNSFGPNIKKVLPQNYSNFMRSGMLLRVLFYENGEWTDFPNGFVGLIKEDFRMKKAAIEVEFRGSASLLDFLHMKLVDLKTGLQLPIAWMDEVGNCFFPEVYSVNDEIHDCFQSGGKENHPHLYSESYDTCEIKLQLEIEVTKDGNLKVEECSEGSTSHVKRLKLDGKCVDNDGPIDEASTDVKPFSEIKEVIGENRPLGSVPPKNPTSGSLNRKLTSDAVKNMFILGMGPSICADDIHDIQPNSGYWAQARLELFQKQAEITGKYRGNANVQYAWLGASKEAVSRILMHGLGFTDLPKTKPTYGIGVHLTSVSSNRISASYYDVDENGVQHMVLCRVILGNMELVHPGSEQSYPSNENFDSGVNDLINPEHYIIWYMNVSTHIYPEYIVSFKRPPPSAKGHSSASSSKGGVSVVTSSTACQEKQQPSSSPIDSVGDFHQIPDAVEMSPTKNSTMKFAGRPPKSAWMPFPMVFAAIEDKVPYSTMKLVHQSYAQFKNNEISRDELVQRMRWVIGDTLLRATIISLRTKAGSGELKVPKQEQGTSY